VTPSLGAIADVPNATPSGSTEASRYPIGESREDDCGFCQGSRQRIFRAESVAPAAVLLSAAAG
jgi:hypothetical protein